MPNSRRKFLKQLGGGLGLLGLANLLGQDGQLGVTGSAPHHPAKAKSVIWLFMNGGPCTFDLFDPKPEVNKRHGQEFPGKIEALFPNPGPIMASPFKFKKTGDCGIEMADVLPHLAKKVDDIAWLKGCVADSKNHGPASYQLCTGMTRMGYPSVGSWVTYGLGSENKDLPGFVVMYDRRSSPEGGANLWSAGFLPGQHQGVPFRPTKSPILYLQPPAGTRRSTQHRQLQLLEQLNRGHQTVHPAEPDLEARIKSFEMAFRMQITAPEVVDISRESKDTTSLYGIDDEKSKHFGTQLLVARRLVERGVRFVQICHGGATFNWDSHQELADAHRDCCRETDQPIAGLLTDLERRGLLDSTLIVWGGEFGRLPVSQNGNGRDHNPFGFGSWMAGGGVKGGSVLGETDDFGYRAIDGQVHIHDIHATILHLLGVNHEELTFHHNGRDVRLTDVYGTVIDQILA